MLIVDSQIHIWKNNKPANPAHRQVTEFTADDVLNEMDAAGVDAALIHPPGWDPNANELAVEAARQHPGRFAILGNFPLDKLESRALVDTWKSRPGMFGLRYAGDAYPYRSIHGHIRQLYDAFGPQRLFWGTDITRMPCTWRQCITMFTEELPWLKGHDLDLVMGRAVCDWIGWQR